MRLQHLTLLSEVEKKSPRATTSSYGRRTSLPDALRVPSASQVGTTKRRGRTNRASASAGVSASNGVSQVANKSSALNNVVVKKEKHRVERPPLLYFSPFRDWLDSVIEFLSVDWSRHSSYTFMQIIPDYWCLFPRLIKQVIWFRGYILRQFLLQFVVCNENKTFLSIWKKRKHFLFSGYLYMKFTHMTYHYH